MCLTCKEKVRTPLYALPGMFRLSGEKLNLSSGMASAASTTRCSMVLIWLSTREAMVGGTAGGAVGAVGVCPGAAAEGRSAVGRKTDLACFMETLLRKETTEPAPDSRPG